jgi:hypothetical protein
MRLASAIAVVVALARLAVAQPSADLTKEFQAGVDAYRLGHYDEARAHLEKARAIDPKLPGPHRFLAAVAQGQGRWQDCIDGARKALELNPLSQEVADTRKLHDECRASAGRAPYRGAELGDSAAIAVTSSVPGATVKIGGLTYGSTPLAPRPITAGTLDIELVKQGWKPAHVTATALAGIVTDVAVELEPDPSAVGNPELDTHVAAKPTVGWLDFPPRLPTSWKDPEGHRELFVDGNPVPWHQRHELQPGTHVIEIRTTGADPWRRRVRIIAGQKTLIAPEFVHTADREHYEHVGFALAGGAGALVAFGFVASLVSSGASADAREIARVEAARDPNKLLVDTTAVEPLHTRATFESERAKASRWGVISDVAFGAALVAGGLAAYHFYKGEQARSDVPPPFAIAPVSGGGAMVVKEGRW